jgi:hypothetical protein
VVVHQKTVGLGPRSDTVPPVTATSLAKPLVYLSGGKVKGLEYYMLIRVAHRFYPALASFVAAGHL